MLRESLSEARRLKIFLPPPFGGTTPRPACAILDMADCLASPMVRKRRIFRGECEVQHSRGQAKRHTLQTGRLWVTQTEALP